MIFAMIITMVVAISTSMRNRHRHHTSISRSIAAARDKLAKFIQGWEAIKERIPSAPHTCTQWACYQEAAEQALLDLKYEVPRLPRGAKNYTRTWTVRLNMMMLMKVAGVRMLVVEEACSIQRFMRMNPDQCGHLRAIYKSNVGRVRCVKDLIELCGWGEQRPELLSCYTCFAGDKGVQHGDFEVSKLNRWAAVQADMKRALGFHPHIVHVAQKLRQKRPASSVQCFVAGHLCRWT